MGVITQAYSIPPKLMRKIRTDHDNLSYIVEADDDENPDWKVENYDFDTGIEETITILCVAGCEKTAKKIDCENYFYSDSKIIWIMTVMICGSFRRHRSKRWSK